MATKLQASFQALYAALEIPRIARRTVVGLLIFHSILLAYSAYVHSPTLNEPGHSVAGLSNWKFGRFDVYNVNPPLVKMVAALPVMAVGYNEDWSGFYEGPGARPEMSMGENFVAANGERSFFLFMIARWVCIPFSWFGAIVCYLWARDLYGRPSGVLAATIWCFEPNILAHASLITADAAGTALGLAACYTFWRWLKQPTWAQAALTGVVLGFAELAKTTLILFYPLWPLMWLIYRLPDRHQMFARDWLREAGMLAVRMAIGLYVLNLGYGFEGSFKPLHEFHFVSGLFTWSGANLAAVGGVSDADTATNASQLARRASPTNRFADTGLGDLPVPFPKNYLLGIDIQQKDFEHYGRPSYLRGKWQHHGWWYYYLYAAAIKVPLGLLALGVFTLIARLTHVISSPCGEEPGRGRLRDEFVLLFPAFVIFFIVSSKTGFSEHFRYVLPSLPFAFIWISQCAQVFLGRQKKLPPKCLTIAERGHYITRGPIWGTCFVPLFSTSLVSLLGCWMVSSSLWIYPHSLSYFNESVGGPLNGAEQLLGSNIDWGQDLLYLRKSIALKPQTIYVAYHGGFDPVAAQVIIGDIVLPLRDQIAGEAAALRFGKYAISINLLYDSWSPARGTLARIERLTPHMTAMLRERMSGSHAGYSIELLHRPLGR